MSSENWQSVGLGSGRRLVSLAVTCCDCKSLIFRHYGPPEHERHFVKYPEMRCSRCLAHAVAARPRRPLPLLPTKPCDTDGPLDTPPLPKPRTAFDERSRTVPTPWRVWHDPLCW